MRIGHGYDAHRLVAGRPLKLGGIEVPHARGLAGHSDGDVLLHAVASALLGALGEGDLGRHFPSSDPALAGVASGELLAQVAARMRAAGLRLGAPRRHHRRAGAAPRALPRRACRRRSPRCSARRVERVNVKVTSTDGLGAIGRGEGIAAHAVVLLEGDA